jgi:hypothetical protein
MKNSKHILGLLSYPTQKLLMLFFIITMLTANFAYGENLLKNGGFETKNAKPDNNLFFQDWPIFKSTKSENCKAELSTDAYEGKYSLKITLGGSPKTNDIWATQKIKVTPGTKLDFEIFAKGRKGKRYYIQFMPQAGTKYLKSTYNFFPLKEKWTKASGSYVVPEGTETLNCIIHMLREPAEVYFDNFKVSISQESMLQNKKVSIKLNPVTGGCVDSFIEIKNGFNYTIKRSPVESGGLCVDILPGNTYPGVFANALYQSKVIVPYKKIQLSRKIESGKFSGLNLVKTISLPEDNSSKIEVSINLKNESDKPLSFPYRVQNVISPESGEFSFPARDWLTIFKRTPQSIKTINSLKLDDLRAGWCAKKYFNQKTMVFNFDNNSVNKIYNYLVKELDTMEWYYREINLQPGTTWQTSYSIELLPSGNQPYSGNLKYKNKPVHIKGLKLAAPKESQKILPKIMQGYFPYGTTLTSMVVPEAGGADSRNLNYLYTYRRQVRELAANYFNNFYFVHLFAGETNLVDALGKDAEKYNMTMTLNMQCIHRKDVDVKAFNEEFPARINKKYKIGKLKKTIEKHKDNILCFYTGDELSASNINCMVSGQETLKKELNTDSAFFPYLILSSKYFEMAKYLPVYLADHYPIYGKNELLRNPWSVSGKVREAVKALPNTPVWLMPQGFASNKNVYSMPTSAEIRLMLYSAISQGAKGIIFFGLNYSSFWMVKVGWEELYSIQSGEGARMPQWETIGQCGKELTAIGPRLFYTKPEWDYNGVSITCPNITKTSRNAKVYQGPAITVDSLKNEKSNIRYLIFINQDDLKEHSFTVKFNSPEDNCYDLTAMKAVEISKTATVKLAPGDACFWILGKDALIQPEIEQIFTNRFKREKVRYNIVANCAAKNGLTIKEAPNGIGQEAYRKIMLAREKLDKDIAASDFGETMKQWIEARQVLSKIDALIRKNVELFIPSKIREKTPNFRYHDIGSDPETSELIKSAKQDFFNYWKLDRAIENGKLEKNRKEIKQLIEKISVDYQKIDSFVKKSEK